ncbi:hypothetical protein BV20DRAFT_530564 [Pilatotrama ljubarskyi]|nr:hypothetical protein BV20DRAFT_530564 [Pilatotrama ljubarskyi]
MLSDWESSLTELSSSEDEEPSRPTRLPRATGRKKPPAKPEYKVTNYLKPYRTTSYTAKSLYDQIVDNTIQLDPEYQRDVVWTETKQVGLIDSLLRNFYIPPVIFAVKRQDDGTETRTCIDGNETNKKYWYQEYAPEKRVLLPKSLRQAFANKQIVCVEYDDLTDDQEREIFQRVQLGVALTAAERMQAIPGPWPALIREVQSIVLGDEGFGEDLDWGHDRGRDFQCLATIIHLIDTHPSTVFPGGARLEKWLSSFTPVPVKTREAVMETFRIFIALVKDKRYNTAFSKPARVSPIEFTMIGALIFRFRKKYSLKQLSSAIWLMRADVRKHHVDIRSNGKVTKTMFRFIEKGLDKLDLASDGKGDFPASVAIKSYQLGGSPAYSQPPLPPTKEKRRRQHYAESSESEAEEAAPRKRPTLASRSVAKTATFSSSSKTKAQTQTTSTPAAVKAAAKSASKSTARATVSARTINTTAAAKAASQLPSPSTASQSTAIPTKQDATRITTRTTRTALLAAADSLALPLAVPAAPQRRRKAPAVEASPASTMDAVKAERSGNTQERMDEDPPHVAGSTGDPPVSAHGHTSGSTGDPDAIG